jgi:hypothetical protein
MKSFNKLMRLNLNYGLPDDRRSDGDGGILPYSKFTGNLIVSAYQINHPQIPSEDTRFYRQLVMGLGVDSDMIPPDYIEFTDADFNKIYKEVYACQKWSPFQALIVPILLDELDKIKNRTEDEEAVLRAAVTAEQEESLDAPLTKEEYGSIAASSGGKKVTTRIPKTLSSAI